MKHWGHLHPKRSICWANVRCISIFNKGKLPKAQQKSTQKPTTQYRNAEGKRKFHGNRLLRGTQPQPYILAIDILQCCQKGCQMFMPRSCFAVREREYPRGFCVQIAKLKLHGHLLSLQWCMTRKRSLARCVSVSRASKLTWHRSFII